MRRLPYLMRIIYQLIKVMVKLRITLVIKIYNFIQSMKKSPTQNSKKSVSFKRQETSYMQRYKAKNSIRLKAGESLDSAVSADLKGLQMSYSEKLVSFFQKGGEISNIKIEEDEDQSQLIKNEYIETELMWFTKIDEMKSMISQIKIDCHQEKRVIQQLQKYLRDRKIKMMRLQENWKRSKRANDDLAIDNCENQISNLQDQYDRLTKESEEELNLVRNERDDLLQQNQQVDQQIQERKEQIESLSIYQQESYNNRINELMIEEETLLQSIDNFQKEKTQLRQKNSKSQQFRPLKEDMHRRYLQLYEKMHMNKQLDKLDRLVRAKEQEIASLQNYQQKKTAFKDKRATIAYRQNSLLQKNKRIDQLTQIIKQKSTTLLNLYQYQGTKSK